MKRFRNSEIKKHSKKTETLFVKIFLMPLASKVALFFVNYTNVKPYHISFLGLFFGMIASLFCSCFLYFCYDLRSSRWLSCKSEKIKKCLWNNH